MGTGTLSIGAKEPPIMRRGHLLLGGVVIAALVAVVFFLSDPPEAPPQLEDVSVAATPGPVAPAAASPDVAPIADRSAATADAEAAAVGPPESYTRFLSGVIGRIVDVDATPVPGMKVEALAVNIQDFLATGMSSLFSGEPPVFDEVKGAAETDEDGRFRFAGLEPRGVYVLAIDQGGPRSTVRFLDDAPNPGEVVDLGDIMLDPFVVFTGRVVDEERRPVAGARVRATNLPSILFNFGVQDLRPGFSVAFQEDLRSGWRVAPIPLWATRLVDRFPIPTTRTEPDGTFRLEGVPIGMVTVLVDASDLLSLVHGPVPSGNGGERALGDLVLRFGETLTGVVLDQDDVPIPDVEILAGAQIEVAPAALLVPGGRTDASGRFAIKGLRDVEHAVAARKEGAAQWHVVTDVVPGFDEAEIRIGSTYQLEVTVLDPDGGVVSRPDLAVQKKDRLPLHPLLSPPIDLARRLSVREDGTLVISDLDPSRYQVLAKKDGYAVTSMEVDLREGSGEAQLVLERELVTGVTVVSKVGGDPVHWASVGVFPAEGSREERRIPLYTRRTDENGFAELAALLPGDYYLAVFHPGFAEARERITVPGAPAMIELLQGGAIEGVVREGNRPPAEQRFIAVTIRGQENFPRFSVSTEESGEFSITHLEPGDYTVVVMRRFANQGIGDMVSGIEQYQPERFVEATVREGEVTRLDIDLVDVGEDGPKAKLRGRITLNGGPGASLAVEHRPNGSWRGRKSAVTDEFGRFDMGEVLAGEGSLRIRQPGQAGRFLFGQLATRALTLAEDEVREEVFEIRTGRLVGRVLADRDGQPLGMTELVLNQDGDDSPWSDGTRMQTAAGKDGAFEFDLVPGGTYRLRARRQGFADANVTGIRVPDAGTAAPVEVRMVTGETVSGTVVLPPLEEEPRFLFVEFRGVDGNDARTGGRVSIETLEYEVKGLYPGEYEVRLRGRRVDVSPLRVVVPSGGRKGLTLTFQPEGQGGG